MKPAVIKKGYAHRFASVSFHFKMTSMKEGHFQDHNPFFMLFSELPLC